MDYDKLGELFGGAITKGVHSVTPNQLQDVLSDEELLEAVESRGLAVGTTAIGESVEAPSHRLTAEVLLSTLDSAIETYCDFTQVINTDRTHRSRKPVEVIDTETIRADVEALLADENVLTDLRADFDFFTNNPVEGSPDVGFDIVIMPEGLEFDDAIALAFHLQAKLNGERPVVGKRFQDEEPTATNGKGYRIAFAPRHFNVPGATTAGYQKEWLKLNNTVLTATELQTATYNEALFAIDIVFKQGDSPLADDYDNGRVEKSYWRCFDATPYLDDIPYTVVSTLGIVNISGSDFHRAPNTRVLFIPKTLSGLY